MRRRVRRRLRRRAAPAVRRCPCAGGAREAARERVAGAGGLAIGGAREPAEARAEAKATAAPGAAAADRAARAMDAEAFTLGRDVAFARGARARGGLPLMAHELAHVAEADGSPAGAVRRTVRVADPQQPIPRPGGRGLDRTNAETVESYLNEICQGGGVEVARDGRVTMDPVTCEILRPVAGEGCDCLCELTGPGHEWLVHVVDPPAPDSGPRTEYADPARAVGRVPGGSGGDVFVPSPNSPVEYGLASIGGEIAAAPPWEILAHELCGHARLAHAGRHPEERPDEIRHGHETVVEMTNRIRQEHIGPTSPLRGHDIRHPYCGESFSRQRGATDWQAGRHLAQCLEQRERYLQRMRRAHADDPRFRRRFTISDRLP